MNNRSVIPNDWTVKQAWQMTEILDALISEIHQRYEVRFALAHDIVNRQFELALDEPMVDDQLPLPRIPPRPLPNLPPEIEDHLPFDLNHAITRNT